MKLRTHGGYAVALLAAAISTSSMAADGTIHFQGLITDTTCSVSVNSSAATATVLLPSVAVSALPEVGSTAGAMPFTINLSACTGDTLGTASTHFEVGPDVDTVSGRLNSTGTADGVQIQMLNADQGPITVGALTSQGDVPVDITSGSATLRYYARYYANADVTPGTVVSRVDYTIQYQ